LASLKVVPDNDPVALRTFSYKLSAILAGLINEDFHQDFFGKVNQVAHFNVKQALGRDLQ